MVDERDMRQEVSWFFEQQAKRCVKSLVRNNINAVYVPNRDEARSQCLAMIPRGATVGMGDSVTLDQCGIIEAVEGGDHNRVFNPFQRDENGRFRISFDEIEDIMRKAIVSDVFLMGTNAITLDGKIVSTDCHGNRVGGLVYGPKKTIVVVGANKIVKDVDEAMSRIKDYAAPLNSRRHVLKHGSAVRPCVETGFCSDCRHAARICNVTVVVEHQRETRPGFDPRLNVILVGEELGI